MISITRAMFAAMLLFLAKGTNEVQCDPTQDVLRAVGRASELLPRTDQMIHIVNETLYVYGGTPAFDEAFQLNDLWKMNEEGTLVHVGGPMNQALDSVFDGDVRVPADATVSFPSPRKAVRMVTRRGKLLLIGGRDAANDLIREIWEFDPESETFALLHSAQETDLSNAMEAAITEQVLQCVFERQEEILMMSVPDVSGVANGFRLGDTLEQLPISLFTGGESLDNPICTYMEAIDAVHFTDGFHVMSYSFQDAVWGYHTVVTLLEEHDTEPLTSAVASLPINKDAFIVFGKNQYHFGFKVFEFVQGHVLAAGGSIPQLDAIEAEVGALAVNVQGNGYAVVETTYNNAGLNTVMELSCLEEVLKTFMATIDDGEVNEAPAGEDPPKTPIGGDAGNDDGFMGGSMGIIIGAAGGGAALAAFAGFMLMRRRRKLNVDKTRFVDSSGAKGVQTADIPMGDVV